MVSSRRRLLAGVLTLACVLVPAATGQAATAHARAHAAASFPFGCRASGARVTLLTATLVEPIVANGPTEPCATDSAASGSILVPTTSPLVTVGPIGAFTYQAGTATVSPGAAAVSDIQAVNIPTPSGTITIVGPVQAYASYDCVNGAASPYGQSTLDVIYVNGQKMTLPTPGAPTTISLGGDSFIALNQQIRTANSVTERVLEVRLAGLADIVVGEAVVTQTRADSCASTAGVPPTLTPCPPGSTLSATAGACVIYYNGQTIFVSLPFKGPTGGTVIALGAARKKYTSHCLYGSGPAWVLVATKRGGRVEGTPHADRILARGADERVAGLAGNDCIDGSGGHQKIFDGNGNDRVYAAAGSNRIGVGNGNDYVNGRNGSDWITAGNGNDTIYGGQGNSRIDVGLGRDHVYGGRGINRVWAGAYSAKVSCGAGAHNQAFVRQTAASYAKSHGCQIIHLLHR